MKIEIPDLQGKELYKFLIDNKSALIAQKKEFMKRADVVCYALPKSGANKSAIPADATKFNVKVVANTSLFCDSQRDVLLKDSGLKSMRERKGLIPHLHDHIHEIGAKVGEVNSIYYQDVPYTELGINRAGVAQCLVFDTDIIKSYNEQVFNQYKTGRIQQHSIGLQYVKLDLAINDPESEKEFDFWSKYIDQVINREYAEEKGFFWVVPEYKLIENSAVLFGSNSLTPTLSTEESKAWDIQDAMQEATELIKSAFNNTGNEPPTGTSTQPFEIRQAINKTKFFTT